MCRKVAETPNRGTIEVWGSGQQTRTFLYIDECLEGTIRLLRSDVEVPVNIGSEEMISINNLARMVADISGKTLTIKNIDGPVGVQGRSSDNRLVRDLLNWAPEQPLRDGMAQTYAWISEQVDAKALAAE